MVTPKKKEKKKERKTRRSFKMYMAFTMFPNLSFAADYSYISPLKLYHTFVNNFESIRNIHSRNGLSQEKTISVTRKTRNAANKKVKQEKRRFAYNAEFLVTKKRGGGGKREREESSV